MKRIFRFLLYLVILLVASAFILPIVFKDSIVDRIKQEANASLNAKLDFEDVNVSLISSFPYFGLDLVGLEISGVDRFENQKLVSVDNFGLYIDLMSVISGDRYSIEEISVEGMDLHVLILADGTANYDIAKVDTTASNEEVSSEASSAFNLALREYRFQDIDFRYQDLEADMDFIIKDLDHQGLGNFTENIVDLKTSTEAQSMTFIMEGVNYLNRVHLASDFDMNLNQEKFEFNFGQNSVALNGLELNFEGMMAMPEEAIDLDLKFSSPSNSFKSLISLIPSIYYQDFDALKTSGEFRLSGAVKGTYVDESYPSFNLALLVREGFFQYPDLPASVQKVNIDLKVENTRADLKNLLVNLSRMDAMVAGSSISSSLRLLDPMNDMQFDFLAKADADLEDLMDAMPLEGYEIAGTVDMDMHSSGRMSMIDNEQYEDLKAGGYLKAANLHFGGDSLGMEVDIPQSDLSLSPERAELGKTIIVYEGQQMEMEGELNNIIAYALRDDLLKGSLDFYSPHLNLMALAGESEPAAENPVDSSLVDSSAMEVIRLPQNLDFSLNASIDTLLYDDLEIRKSRGTVKLKEGIADLDLNMSLLNGQMSMLGSFNSVIPQPLADFQFGIKDFSFRESYKALDMVKQIAPVMENVEGQYNLGLAMNVHMGDDMSPLLNTVNATGLLSTRTLQIGGKVFSQLATFLNNPDYEQLKMNDLNLEFSIEDGTLKVEPMDFKLAGQKATFGGTMNLDQSLDFDLQTDLPLEKLKAQKYLGQFQSLSSGSIPLSVKIGGTASDPEVKPSLGDLKNQLGAEIKNQVKKVVDSAKTIVKQEVNDKLDQLVSAAEAQGDKLIAEAKAKGDLLKAEAKKQADKLRSEGEKAAQKILDEAGSNPLKQAAAKPLAERTRNEANEKAQKIEDEAVKKADDLVKAAENQKQKLVEDARAKAQI